MRCFPWCRPKEEAKEPSVDVRSLKPSPPYLIVVTGATGRQGGAVVDALLAVRIEPPPPSPVAPGTAEPFWSGPSATDPAPAPSPSPPPPPTTCTSSGVPRFTVRGITRDPTSARAKALEAKGVEIVKADMDDTDSLIEAFTGAYGAFFVTNFWEHLSGAREQQQIKNLADAAKTVGLRFVVNSTLEDTRTFYSKQRSLPPVKEDMYVPHFDAKGSMIKYVEKAVPTSHIYTSFYFENFLHYGLGPHPDEQGDLIISFNMANKVLPMVAVADIGRTVAKMFELEAVGQHVFLSSPDALTCNDVAKAFSKSLDRKVEYRAVSNEEYAKLNFPGAEEMATMFRYKVDDPSFAEKRLEGSRHPLLGDMMKFKAWLAEHQQELKDVTTRLIAAEEAATSVPVSVSGERAPASGPE